MNYIKDDVKELYSLGYPLLVSSHCGGDAVSQFIQYTLLFTLYIQEFNFEQLFNYHHHNYLYYNNHIITLVF